MRTVYLIDYIGRHSGMDYYLEAFRKVLESIPGCRVEILSNYDFGGRGRPFFINQYKGKILRKGVSLIINLWRLIIFTLRHKNSVMIYLTYGNPIDIPFLRIVSRNKHSIVDIHEAIAQNIDSNDRYLKKFREIYSKKIESVIAHSSRTISYLRQFGFQGEILEVPHFKYVFPQKFDLSNISSEIVESIDTSRINLLFFGNLNKSKGVDIILEAFNHLDGKVANKFNLVIAGKDFDGSVRDVIPLPDRRVQMHVRHISDDELRFLYQEVDFICLPYRKTSQSGILEMAFYFRKPIIASDLPYFRSTLETFPSFGILAGNGVEDYAKALTHIAGATTKNFFSDEEYARYENRREIEDFKKDFADWLNKQ